MSFKKNENVSFSKKNVFLYFVIFPNLKIGDFLPKKTSHFRWENFAWKKYQLIGILQQNYQLCDVEKIKSFPERTHLFFQENPNFVRFEKSHYFSRILRQICLDKKIEKSTSQSGFLFPVRPKSNLKKVEQRICCPTKSVQP